MYLLAKFGDHRSYRNEDINSYMNTYEKAELTAYTWVLNNRPPTPQIIFPNPRAFTPTPIYQFLELNEY